MHHEQLYIVNDASLLKYILIQILYDEYVMEQIGYTAPGTKTVFGAPFLGNFCLKVKNLSHMACLVPLEIWRPVENSPLRPFIHVPEYRAIFREIYG